MQKTDTINPKIEKYPKIKNLTKYFCTDILFISPNIPKIKVRL